MRGVFTANHSTYIALPRDPAFLYVEFAPGTSFRSVPKPRFEMRLLLSEGVEVVGYFQDTYESEREGKALLAFNHPFFRGEIDPDRVEGHPGNLEESLTEWLEPDKRGIDSEDEYVIATAEQILSHMPAGSRENPFMITQALVEWVKENIDYVIVPSYAIDCVTERIRALPESERDPLGILRSSFNFKEKYLVHAAKGITLPTGVEDPRELAKELMRQADDRWGGFQLLWWGDGTAEASITLQRREGKCVGMAHAFVALSRSLGVPARTESGYAFGGDDEGNHSWASVYLHPYGWVEVDPTWGQFQDFSYEDHCYGFSWGDSLPQFTVVDAQIVLDHPEGLEKLLSWFDSLQASRL